MSAIQDAREILAKWGKELTEDLEVSLNQALKAGGSRKPQQSALQFGQRAFIDGGGVGLHITANLPYWRYIEHGVDGNKMGRGATQGPEGRVYKYTSKGPNPDVFGEKWQKSNNIDARVVLLNIKAKAKAKKNGLNFKPSKFKKLKKTLDYKTATNQFAYIVQKSVFYKGLKKRRFIDPVLEDGRIEVLSSTLAKVLGNGFRLEIITELNGSNQ